MNTKLLANLSILALFGCIGLGSSTIGMYDESPLSIEWEFFYGGSGDDRARWVIQTIDGGYAFVGSTTSYGNGRDDGWLVKMDSNGVALWNKTYGGTLDDRFQAILETPDNGYFLAGVTASYGNGENDIWLIKIDSQGNSEWNKTFGTTGIDEMNYFIKTSDGGYLICGRYTTPPDAWLIKLDSNGNEQWNRTFGGIKFDRLFSVVEVSSGGYLSTGWTGNSPKDLNYGDVLVYRHNSTGNELWNTTYGSVYGGDHAYDVIETPNGNFVISAVYSSHYDGADSWLFKINENGTKIWETQINGPLDDFGGSVLQVDDGYLQVVHSKSFGSGNGDNVLIKVDKDGNIKWNFTNGYPEDDELAFDMIQSSDGGFVLGGRILSKGAGGEDAWLFKLTELDIASSQTSANSNSPGFEGIIFFYGAIIYTIVRRKFKK